MARMIGRTNSWLWWLAGVFCAFCFGPKGYAGGDRVVQPPYGVRPPPPDERLVNDTSRQQANKLIDEYLAEQSPAPPPADLKELIAALIKKLGADEWAAREEASKSLVKLGKPALPALKEAVANNKDAEVVNRARDCVEKIGGGSSAVDALRALGPTGQFAIQQRIQEERRKSVSAAGSAGEAELAGKKDEAEKFRSEAKLAQERAGSCTKLLTLLAQTNVGPQPAYGVMMARYGVVRIIEKD